MRRGGRTGAGGPGFRGARVGSIVPGLSVSPAPGLPAAGDGPDCWLEPLPPTVRAGPGQADPSLERWITRWFGGHPLAVTRQGSEGQDPRPDAVRVATTLGRWLAAFRWREVPSGPHPDLHQGEEDLG